jgi:hypothetical protein
VRCLSGRRRAGNRSERVGTEVPRGGLIGPDTAGFGANLNRAHRRPCAARR